MTVITLSVFHFIKDDEFLTIRNCFLDPCRQASPSHDEPGGANRHFRDITLGAAIPNVTKLSLKGAPPAVRAPDHTPQSRDSKMWRSVG
jgi:hypothetical protein